MVAAPRLRKKENTTKADIKGEPFPSLHKAVAIYGPNASGKSSIVKALRLLQTLARREPSAEKRPLPVAPFKFDTKLLDKPSEFEVHFVESGRRYSLMLSLTSDRIHGEELVEYIRGHSNTLYTRNYQDGHDIYRFGETLEGGATLHEAWRKLTSPQVMFLSQAVANSNEELTQLRAPFKWLTELMVEEDGMRSNSKVTQRLIADLPSLGDTIAALLSDVDVPVTSIRTRVNDKQSHGSESSGEIFADVSEKNKALLKTVYNSSEVATTLTHKTSLGEAEFDISDESDGTKNLIGFAFPWLIFRQDEKNSRRRILVVDEIDSSLHPKVVESLIRRHISSNSNCQLIFTTHDTHLMDTKILRRDQIWLTERDDTGATQLRSVHDFSGRESEDIEKRYYEGRYRGLPFLKGG